MSCDPIERVVPALIGECDPIDFGCIPLTDGMPIVDPNPDQIPFAWDPDLECMWLWVCENGWTEFCGGGESNECPCIEPIILSGLSGVLSNNKCYTLFEGRIIDTTGGSFDGGVPLAGLPIEFVFTNPTNAEGVLTVNAKMWANRTVPGDGVTPAANLKASVMFMLGETTAVDSYPMDPEQTVPGGQAQTPHNDRDVSYDIREFPLDETFAFWGRWREVALCAPGVDCYNGREAAADVDHKFVVAAGASVTIKARIVVGFEAEITPGDVETGWVGADVKYLFEGHNETP